MSDDRKFVLYWLNGKSETVQGRDATEAIARAGYGRGAIPALDFMAPYGDGIEYEWSIDRRTWVRKVQAARTPPEPAESR